MSIIVLGLSHRSAPLSVLEAVSMTAEQVSDLGARLMAGETIQEAVVLATCNRLELYVAATNFHGAVDELTEALVGTTELALDRFKDHLYVHYEEGAIAHAFSVACGLDSMAVGEAQVLGQLREALRRSQAADQTGPVLNGLLQQALRVGKRAHTDTDLDHVSLSLVEAGLDEAAHVVGPLDGCRVLVIGAGAMAGLAAATVSRQAHAGLTIISRTPERARRLAARSGGTAADTEDLTQHLAAADVVISCTGAMGHVVTAAQVGAAAGVRDRAQAYLDLAMPRDVAPEARDHPGVAVFGLEDLRERLAAGAGVAPVHLVRELVAEEVETFLAHRRAQEVGPTVKALRSRAAQVVDAEMARLETRLQLDEGARGEVQLAVHRVVEKLLHTPTVRVKQLASSGSGGDYARALRELFDLDPQDIAVVAAPKTGSLPGVNAETLPTSSPSLPAAPTGSAIRTDLSRPETGTQRAS